MGRRVRTPQWPGFKVLVRRLGLRGCLKVGARVQRRLRRGDPFTQLPPATDADEAASRAQIGPAIVLYEELRRERADDEALRITREVVLASGVVFMRRTLGPLRRAELAGLDAAGQARFAEDRAARFFNATLRWDTISAQEVRFTVTACRFPRLCAAAGAPQLAALFCEVDAAYFGSVEPGVVLERSQTLAGGGTCCPFTLRWRDEAP